METYVVVTDAMPGAVGEVLGEAVLRSGSTGVSLEGFNKKMFEVMTNWVIVPKGGRTVRPSDGRSYLDALAAGGLVSSQLSFSRVMEREAR